MLTITIPEREYWDESANEFVSTKEQVLTLEHSLISISKWESKWHKPFLETQEKTEEETIDYIRCMVLNGKTDQLTFRNLGSSNVKKIKEYIEDPMTATWFPKKSVTKGTGEKITSELIYYWMIALNIPPEYQKWHLNRLMTLIKVCDAKNQPSKKMSKGALANQNAAINAARRKKFNSRG